MKDNFIVKQTVLFWTERIISLPNMAMTSDYIKHKFSSSEKIYVLVSEKERKGEQERNINLLFHLFTDSLVASCMFPDHGQNPQTLAYQDNTPTN